MEGPESTLQENNGVNSKLTELPHNKGTNTKYISKYKKNGT